MSAYVGSLNGNLFNLFKTSKNHTRFTFQVLNVISSFILDGMVAYTCADKKHSTQRYEVHTICVQRRVIKRHWPLNLVVMNARLHLFFTCMYDSCTVYSII